MGLRHWRDNGIDDVIDTISGFGNGEKVDFSREHDQSCLKRDGCHQHAWFLVYLQLSSANKQANGRAVIGQNRVRGGDCAGTHSLVRLLMSLIILRSGQWEASK